MTVSRAQELKTVPNEFKENIFSSSLEAKHMSRDTMNEMFQKMKVADLGKNLGQVNYDLFLKKLYSCFTQILNFFMAIVSNRL